MENKKLYVGNLNYSVTKEQLETLFSQYGTVAQATVIQDKGFGFVEMSTAEEAEKAREALNKTDFVGRSLRIDEARPSTKPSGPRTGNGGPRGNFRPRQASAY